MVFIQKLLKPSCYGFYQTTVLVFHFVKAAMNCSFLKILFVLAFPFLPLLLYICLPPSFPTSLPPFLLLPLLDCSMHFQDSIPSSFCTMHRHDVLRRGKASHWWRPKNVLSHLGPVNLHCRNSCYIVHFSSKVAKMRPVHFNHHLYKWAKFGAKNWWYDKNILNIFTVYLTPYGSFVPRGSRFSKWPRLFTENTVHNLI